MKGWKGALAMLFLYANVALAADSIVINIPSFTLTHTKDGKINKYSCRVGKKSTPTKIGTGKVYVKIKNPVFRDDKGVKYTHSTIRKSRGGKFLKRIKIPYELIKSMGMEINGRRDGQMIHSTTNPETIGYAHSNGCVGLVIKDMLKLEKETEVNTNLATTYKILVKNEEGYTFWRNIYGKEISVTKEIEERIADLWKADIDVIRKAIIKHKKGEKVYIPFKELYKQEKRGLKDIKNKYKEKPDNYYKNKFKKLKNKV